MLSRALLVLTAALGLSACIMPETLDTPSRESVAALEAAENTRPDRPCRSLPKCSVALNKAVSSAWRLPPGIDEPGLLTTLRVKVDGQGVVQSIAVYRSSGNDRFDAAAHEAVQRAQPFHELKGLNPTVIRDGLELEFRFHPQMARQVP
jgi:colicin import membrane protein